MRRLIQCSCGLLTVVTAFAGLIYLIQAVGAFGTEASPEAYLPIVAVLTAVSVTSAVIGWLVKPLGSTGDV